MAYNFLCLVNSVCKALNEVELNTSTFPNAVGFYAHAKDGVNFSIRSINQEAFEWPFNHKTEELVLTEGQVRYPYPTDAKTIDMDSFRIKRDSTLNVRTTKLSLADYDEYLESSLLDSEYNPDIYDVPEFVFRTPDLRFGVVPAPDQEYTLVYEYYRLPVDLEAATDVPTIPEIFKNVIVDGAMVHAHTFRGDNESSELASKRFQEGIKNMRTIYINRFNYVRSTMR